MKSPKAKKHILEELRKTPIIASACEKAGISRQTFYRWCEENPKFREATERALAEGSKSVCDDVESKLFDRINKGDMTAIKYFLDRRHPEYRTEKSVKFKIAQLQEKVNFNKKMMDPAELAEYPIPMLQRLKELEIERYTKAITLAEEKDRKLVEEWSKLTTSPDQSQ